MSDGEKLNMVGDTACPNCGAGRSKNMSEVCPLCASKDVFISGIPAGYLYPEENRQIVVGIVRLVMIIVVVPLIFLIVALIQYRDLFFSLAPVEFLSLM